MSKFHHSPKHAQFVISITVFLLAVITFFFTNLNLTPINAFSLREAQRKKSGKPTEPLVALTVEESDLSKIKASIKEIKKEAFDTSSFFLQKREEENYEIANAFYKISGDLYDANERIFTLLLIFNNMNCTSDSEFVKSRLLQCISTEFALVEGRNIFLENLIKSTNKPALYDLGKKIKYENENLNYTFSRIEQKLKST